MDGYLRIRSDRSPYRRAGLSFGQDKLCEVSPIALAAAQLVALVQDPALRVEIWKGGNYELLGPWIDGEALDEAAAEAILEWLRANLGAEATPAVDDSALQLATALGELQRARAEILKLEAELKDANAEGDELAEQLEKARARIVALEAQSPPANGSQPGTAEANTEGGSDGAKPEEGGGASAPIATQSPKEADAVSPASPRKRKAGK